MTIILRNRKLERTFDLNRDHGRLARAVMSAGKAEARKAIERSPARRAPARKWWVSKSKKGTVPSGTIE